MSKPCRGEGEKHGRRYARANVGDQAEQSDQGRQQGRKKDTVADLVGVVAPTRKGIVGNVGEEHEQMTGHYIP